MASSSKSVDPQKFPNVTKRCAWGTCNSDSRYPERCIGIKFIPFVKPGKYNYHLEKCLRWIKACGRPHDQLNVNKIKRWTYVCSKHFVDGESTVENPDPISAVGDNTRKRKFPTPRPAVLSARSKTRKILITPLLKPVKAVKEELPDSDIPFNQMVELEIEGLEIEQMGVNVFYDGQIAEMRSNIKEEETKEHSQNPSINKKSRCELCGAEFVRATSFMVHMSVYHGQDLQILPSHDSSLNNNRGSGINFYNSKQTDDDLYNLSNPESEKAYKCSGCEKTFSRSVVLKTHQDLPEGQNLYKCIDCKKAFDLTTSNLDGHGSIHSDNILYKSTDFKKVKIQLSILNGHHLQIEVDKPSECTDYNSTYTHTCIYCNKAFSNKCHLTAHLNRYAGGKLCECSDCGKAFHLPSELKKHQRIHTGAYNLYKCTDCGKAFDYLHKLKSHQIIHKGDKPYKCTDCSKAFKRSNSLKAHQRVHTGDKSYKCTDCGKAFCRLSSLKLHQRLHTGDQPYKCTNCDKAFSNRNSFGVHLLKHTGDKPYKCTDCDKAFYLLDYLKDHQRIHASEKPFSCTYCCKTFRKRCNLRNHLRIHTGDKPYKCTDCDKAFNQNSSLKAHQRRHTRDQAYSRCTECGNDFSDKKKFNKHICVHKGDDPNKCADCGKTFSKQCSLKRHKKKACTRGKPLN